MVFQKIEASALAQGREEHVRGVFLTLDSLRKLMFYGQSKKEGKDLESIQSITCPTTSYGKVSKHKKTSHTRKSRGHLKATRRFDKDKHETQKAKRIHKISTVLEQSVRNY